ARGVYIPPLPLGPAILNVNAPLLVIIALLKEFPKKQKSKGKSITSDHISSLVTEVAVPELKGNGGAYSICSTSYSVVPLNMVSSKSATKSNVNSPSAAQ